MSEQTLGGVAGAIGIVLVVSILGLVAARLTHRAGLRRLAVGGLAFGLVALVVAAQFDRRAEDCARRGGTMVDDAPYVIDGARGRTALTRQHCVLPSADRAG